MASTEPSLFYTGLVAELYGPLRGVVPDPEPYARFIARSGEPALELGCGDGDPLLALRSRGIDVEGLDSSPDMLDRCRCKASALGVEVVLHLQRMEQMDLERRYRSIYLAGPTFNLLADDDTAFEALTRIRAQLLPDGGAMIPLFVPAPTPADQLGRPRSHRPLAGTEMRFSVLAEWRDERTRLQRALCRYELISPTETVTEERDWVLHWYAHDTIRDIAADAGLTVASMLTFEGRPAATDDDAVVLLLAPTHGAT